MVFGLYFFFKGYVTVEIKGSLNEKIINKCIRNGIFMWDVKPIPDGLSVNIRSCDMEKLKEAVSGHDILFKNKRGVPFILDRFKKRYALIFGVLIFVFVTAFLSSLVWSINIVGCSVTDEADIIRILSENGVKKWCFKKQVNDDKLKKMIMNGLDTVSWVGVDLKGTTINLEIKERRAIPYIVDKNAVDIIAAKDGVISKMSVRSGEKMVAPGDTVIKGQLLVSALVERDGDYILEHPYTVHSYGDVIARTWYTYNLKYPLYDSVTEYTGNQCIKRKLNLFGYNINLYIRSGIPFEEYEKYETRRGRVFQIDTTVFKETKTERTPINVDEALERTVLEAEKMLPDSVLSSKCLTKNYTVANDYIIADIVFECTENIAVEVPHTKQGEITNDSENNKIQ